MLHKKSETQEYQGFTIDTDKAKILHLMGAQLNPQLQLRLKNLPLRQYEMYSVDITLEQKAFLVGGNINEFSNGFIIFLNNPNVTYEGIGDEDEEIKLGNFSRDNSYYARLGDKKAKDEKEQNTSLK